MNDRSKQRRPATFRLDDANVVVVESDEAGKPARGTVQITPEPDPALLPVPIEAPVPPRRAFGWGTVFWTGLAAMVLLGLGLGVVNLIEDLFARSESLGIVGIFFTFATAFALGVITLRELLALVRLATIEKLHARAAAVMLNDDRDESRAILKDLLSIAHEKPQLARARTALTAHADEIIDGADLIKLAERELMTPLDQEARRLVSSA